MEAAAMPIVTAPQKMVQTYKKLEENPPKKEPKKEVKQENKKQQSKTEPLKVQKKVSNAQQIKVNIQTKKNDKPEIKQNSNNFQSPMIKGNKTENLNKNNKPQLKNPSQNNGQKKEEKKEEVAQTPLKKAKKNGLKLQALNHALPKNLQECHERFFESDFKINP